MAVLASADPAAASINLAFDSSRPALRVDARGNAWVSFTTGGVRHTTFVPPRGKATPHVSLAARDVSRPASDVSLPFAKVIRRTPDGRLWALQQWRVNKGGPYELHFSRWRGAGTQVSLSVSGNQLVGAASFQGAPVPLYSPDDEGTLFRHYAYLACSGCAAARVGMWARMLGAPLRTGGRFALYLRPEWQGTGFRATVVGPNRGSTLAPDGSAIVSP